MRLLRISNFSELSIENTLLLNEIAEECREEYNDFIGDLNLQNRDNLFWWSSPVSSRNTHVDKSFEHFCKFKLIVTLLESKTYDKVDVDIEILYYLLYSKYGREKVVPKNFSNIKDSLFKRIYFVIRLVFYQFLKYFSIRISSFIFNIKVEKNVDIVFETNIYRNSFNPEFSDRHFPHLEKVINQSSDLRFSYLANLYGVKNFLKTMYLLKKSKYSFILMETFIGCLDFLKCVFYFLNHRSSPKFIFANEGERILSEIVKYSFYRSFYSFDVSNSLMRFYAIKGMARNGIFIKTFVLWFENIGINKVTIIALNKFCPYTTSVGYQGIFTSPNSVGNHLIKEEYECNVLPKNIGFMGSKLFPNYTWSNFIVMPAFRYFDVIRSRDYFEKINCTSRAVLVALPIDVEESRGLIRFIAEFKNDLSLEFYFRPHPASNRRKVEQELFALNFSKDRVVFSNIDLSDFRVVVTLGSGIAIESLLSCIPVVIVGSRTGLALNPIPRDFLTNYWHLVFDQIQFLSFLDFVFSATFDRKAFIDQVLVERGDYCSGPFSIDYLFKNLKTLS